MTEVLIAAYVALGLAYYVVLRRAEGPQGLEGFVSSLVLGGLTIMVLAAITAVTVIAGGLYLGAKAIVTWL